MSYRRAFSTLGCPGATLDEALALAAAHQIDAVELRTLEGTTDLPALFARRFGTPDTLAAQVARQPVAIASIDTSLRLADPKPGDFEAFLQFVPWAEALGVRWLRVFDGGTPATSHDAMLATWQRWRALRAERGWQCDLMIETHDALFTACAVRAFTARAPEAAILWDSHHTLKKGGEDPVATWRAIKPHVVHVHVKDSVSRPSERHPFTYVLPGEGEFPMAALSGVLASEFEGTVSLEWEKQWHPYLPPLGDALRAAISREWFAAADRR